MNQVKNLTLIALAALAIGTGCTRARRLENPTPIVPQPAAAATESPPEATLAPAATQPATGTPSPTPVLPGATPSATATLAALPDHSDPLAGQLDDSLAQFDQSVGSVDTLEDPP